MGIFPHISQLNKLFVFELLIFECTSCPQRIRSPLRRVTALLLLQPTLALKTECNGF